MNVIDPHPIAAPYRLRFILAGNATFTVRSEKTGTRFTFRVRQPKPTTPHFVSLLTGPDNENSYTYLGTIFNGTEFAHGRKSTITPDAAGAIAARWVFNRILQGLDLNNCEVWHEGRCGRCGRKLTVPESIESGFGPECITRI